LLARSALLTLALTLATGLVFGLAPELDLAAAQVFWREGAGFIGVTPAGEMLRSIFFAAPFWIAGLVALGWVLRRLNLPYVWLPSGRAIAFLALSLALGPGLLVNVILKDNSHRPRPVQTQELGGTWEFRPWYRFDGQCDRNCSFVSGEAASAFWTVGPALLAPAPVRPVAVAAALAFGTATALLRMAFGGHYLSDTIFAGLFTILIVLGLYRLLLGKKSKESGLRDDHAAL
jgi:membrane-associated phospholipid phosphatase